jgi:hypothetical protein
MPKSGRRWMNHRKVSSLLRPPHTLMLIETLSSGSRDAWLTSLAGSAASSGDYDAFVDEMQQQQPDKQAA